MSLAAAIRQVMTQVVRLLEEKDPAALLREGSAVTTALDNWRKAVAAQTSGVSRKRARDLEQAKLESMGQAAKLQKERDDLAVRNQELREQLVKQTKKEEGYKQQLLDAQFSGTGHRAEAKGLDLEVRELRRRVRELEGGPPLSAAEAAPQSKQKPVAEADKPDKPKLTVVQPGPSVQDRRAAAEAAFRAMWKPKAQAPAQKPAGGEAHPASSTAGGPARPKSGKRPRRRGGRRSGRGQTQVSNVQAQKSGLSDAQQRPKSLEPSRDATRLNTVAPEDAARRSTPKKPSRKPSATRTKGAAPPQELALGKLAPLDKGESKKKAATKPKVVAPAAASVAKAEPTKAAATPKKKVAGQKQAAAPKAAAKASAAKKAAPKKAAPKKAAAKASAAKAPAVKKAAPKKAAPKKAVPKKVAPKKVAPKKATPKKAAPKKAATSQKKVGAKSKSGASAKQVPAKPKATKKATKKAPRKK